MNFFINSEINKESIEKMKKIKSGEIDKKNGNNEI